MDHGDVDELAHQRSQLLAGFGTGIATADAVDDGLEAGARGFRHAETETGLPGHHHATA